MHETSRPLTLREFEKIISYCRKKQNKVKNKNLKFVYFRNACLFSLLWFIGCRPREAYASLLTDLDLRNNTFFINGDRNKVKKSRTRKIPKKLRNILVEYLQQKNKLFPNSKYLFPSIKNNCIARRSLQLEFQRILKSLNLLEVNFIDNKNVPRYSLNLYSFRKGHGTYLYEKTGDPYLVQKSLDHLNIETTCKFYIRAMPEIISEKILMVFS